MERIAFLKNTDIIIVERMGECSVCCEALNNSYRSNVTCPYCKYITCAACASEYLCGTPEYAHCMSCKKGWDRGFLSQFISKAFVKGRYKTAREKHLIDREMSLMPATQMDVERIKYRQKQERKIYDLNKEMSVLKIERARWWAVDIPSKKTTIQLDIDIFVLQKKVELCRFKMDTNATSTPKKTFIRKCSGEACRGFLSSQWKCGLCEKYTCKECLEVKFGDDHTCNPESVETAKLLNSDSKPCPGCGAIIFKVNGCFAENTPILMYDGSIKMSQDIVTGDRLMGDDGKVKTVQNIVSGEDDMYRIDQTKGISYTVNSKHTMILKYSSDFSISKKSKDDWVLRYLDPAQLVIRSVQSTDVETLKAMVKPQQELEVTVSDYIGSKLYTTYAKSMMCFKSGYMEWPEKDIRLDPYIMGLWIGDGINNGMSFASNDTEILQYLLDWCTRNNLELVHDAPYKYRVRRRGDKWKRLAIGKGATSEECKVCSVKFHEICDTPYEPYTDENVGDSPHLVNILESYNLVRNKHIPIDYLMNSKDVRNKVLAGLIDSDGHVTNDGKRIIISQTNPVIVQQIEFLSRSLGYTVNVTRSERKNVKLPNVPPKDYPDSYSINISGEYIHEIPTILPRKKCASATPNKNGLVTGFTVTPVGRGKYYGWSVDGNKRFLLKDFSCVRNCNQMFCTLCTTAFNWTTGLIVTGRIHNPHYFEYLRNRDITVREIGDIPCGGLPTRDRLVGIPPECRDDVWGAYRLCIHIEEETMHSLRPRDTKQYRIDYLMDNLTEADLKVTLQRVEKANSKKLEYRLIYTMFCEVCGDLFRNITQASQYAQLVVEMKTLVNYANDQFVRIADAFDCKPPRIYVPGWSLTPPLVTQQQGIRAG